MRFGGWIRLLFAKAKLTTSPISREARAVSCIPFSIRGRDLLTRKEVLLLIDHAWIFHGRLDSVPENDSCLKRFFGRAHRFLFSMVVFAT